MFIQTEQTPNPRTVKFIPGVEVMQENQTASFTSAEDAAVSPLAEALFGIKHVQDVFFGSDFVTVTHDGEGDWSVLKPYVLTTVMDHFISGMPLFHGQGQATDDHDTNKICEDDPEVVKDIKELLETRVRPAVAQDGGDIVYKAFEDGVVYLELRGACSGCPSATMTLKDGVENMMKHYIPEVERVEAVNGMGY